MIFITTKQHQFWIAFPLNIGGFCINEITHFDIEKGPNNNTYGFKEEHAAHCPADQLDSDIDWFTSKSGGWGLSKGVHAKKSVLKKPKLKTLPID